MSDEEKLATLKSFRSKNNKNPTRRTNQKGNKYIKMDTSKVLGVILEWQISGKTRVS
jgi:hypothetical protein